MSKPRRSSEMKGHALEDETMLYSPDRSAVFSLNVTAKTIWDLCDGDRTVEAIVQTLAERYGCSSEDLAADVSAAIEQLREADLLEPENDDDGA